MNQRVNPALAWPLECRVSLSRHGHQGTGNMGCPLLASARSPSIPSPLPPPLPGQNLVSIIQGEIFGMTHKTLNITEYQDLHCILAHGIWSLISGFVMCGPLMLGCLWWVILSYIPALAWVPGLRWRPGPRSSIVEWGPRGSDQNVDWAGVTIYNVICIQTSSGEEWRGNKQGNLYQWDSETWPRLWSDPWQGVG